jgi:hypothetical protein
MWQTVVAATLIYAYGHPAFDGFRPSALDAPLHAFHAAANDAVRDGQRTLLGLDRARAQQHLNVYYDRIETELRPAESRAAVARSSD